MSVMHHSNSLSLAALAMEPDERSLAQRFAEGDAAAFEAVVTDAGLVTRQQLERRAAEYRALERDEVF